MRNALSRLIANFRLAEELYGSHARFIFELLQNADDNKFSEAAKRNAVPNIKFKMFSSKILVECNEDGFTERDMQAICAVGRSTKSVKYGYIGAKGIGFKSVFLAASEVYIQSGNFSFRFLHPKGDPGLGMVRPLWVEPKEKLHGPLTRMELRLHDDGGNLRQSVFDQLKSLKSSCFLFLRNLQRINVEFYDDDDKLTRSTEFRKVTIDRYRTGLIEQSVVNGQASIKSQLYHVTKLAAHDLPCRADRKAPDTESGMAHASTAEVILAFPLTKEYTPMCDHGQELFAFLPLCSHGYKVSAARTALHIRTY